MRALPSPGQKCVQCNNLAAVVIDGSPRCGAHDRVAQGFPHPCVVCGAANDKVIHGKPYCKDHDLRHLAPTAERCANCGEPATRTIFGKPCCANDKHRPVA